MSTGESDIYPLMSCTVRVLYHKFVENPFRILEKSYQEFVQNPIRVLLKIISKNW